MHNKAFFLDRDGVINADHGYVSKPEDFEFLPEVFEACRRIQSAGYLIIIVTNQAGIARGYYSEADFQSLTTWMLARFAEEGVSITDVEYCPHHPTAGMGAYKQACQCRKPEPGMIIRACEKHNIDPGQSVMVGDKPSDMDAAINAGIPSRYAIEGNYPFGEHSGFSCKSLIDAVAKQLTT